MNRNGKKTALVTGATGVIGPVLIRYLLHEGYNVRVLIRRDSKNGLLPEDLDKRFGDLTDNKALNEAAAGVAVIFHLAAKLHIDRPELSHKEEYKEVNVEGTRRVVNAAKTNAVRRLIFFSTINVYGPSTMGMVYDETSPIYPDSWYAQTKAQAEAIVLDGLPSVVLRLAAVYGPGMKGNYLRLLQAIRRGYFLMIGDGCNRRTLVFIRDVCRAALLAAEHPDALGQIYNVTDGEVHTLRELIKAICELTGKRPPRFELPTGLVRQAFGLIEDGFRLVGRRSPFGRSTVDKIIEDLAVSGDRIKRKLGFRPQYDLLRGWQETINGMSV
jgi:UDP-glucose 4-epimerase